MTWFLLPLLLLQTPQVMPRDSPERPTEGTALIRGRVTASDTGLPMRRAAVTLMGESPALGPSRSRTVATDAEGRFAFTRLPAGSYRLRAAPGSYRGQYLAVVFGGQRASDIGSAIELADGQRFDASDIALPRGAAITGRVMDDFGEPVARVGVSASRVMPGPRYQRAGMGFNQTDDLGRFRLYGLEPGEYILAAEARDWGGGGPPPDGPTEGFATTYFPSALSEPEAGRVRVSNSDVGDYEIVLVRTRTFRVTGTIVDSQGRQVMPIGAQLIRASGPGRSGSSGRMSHQPGRFTFHDVVPGEYRLVVRPVSYSSHVPGASPPVSQEYASVPLSVTSDIEDLVIVTQPGVSIAGRVTFAEAPPAKPPSALRVFAQPADRLGGLGPTPTALVNANLQFTLDGLFGEHFIRLGGMPPRYALKAVMLGQTDITDTPLVFTREHSTHLELVLTSRTSALEGTVTDEKGGAAENVFVLVIPEDKSAWNRQSPRFRMDMIQKAGRFGIGNVLPGRYYVVAVPRELVPFTPDVGPEQFEALTKEATMVVVGEDEKRTVDLRVASVSQER